MHERQAVPVASFPEALTSSRPTSRFRTFWRGIKHRCPACGEGHLYRRYLKVNDVCLRCGSAIGEIRSDDAPPYFTILLVGHLIVPSMLILEELRHPPEWVHAVLWVPLTLLLTLVLLPRIKGAVIAVHWANQIKG